MKNTSHHSSEVQDQDLLRALLESHPMQMAFLDAEFNFVQVNRAYAEADGKEPSDFPGKNHFDLYPNEENQQIFQKVVETGQSFQIQAKPIEYEKNKERGLSWWDWSLAPVKDDAEIVTGLIISLVDVTASKRAQEDMHRYESIVSSSSDMLALLDNRFVYLAVNDKYAEAFDRPTSEFVGATPSEILGDAFFQAVIRPHAEKCMRGEVVRYQDWFDFPTSGRRYMEITYTPYVDPELNSNGFSVNGRDMTERKRAEQALRLSEQNFRSIYHSANDAIFVHDIETGCIVDVNRTMCEMYGYSIEEARLLDAKKTSSGISPYDQEHATEFIKKAVAGESQIFEWHARDKAGRLFWVEVNLKRAVIGEKDRVLAIVRDITERKRAEEALIQSEESFKTLFKLAPLSYQSLDEDGNFLEVNEMWCQTLGYSRDEVIGRSFAEFIDPDFKNVFERCFPMFKDAGSIDGVEHTMIKKDGARIIASFVGRVGCNEDGSFKQTHCIFADITERKRAEEELALSKQRLELAHEAAGMGMFDWNIVHGQAVCNDRYFEVFGLEPQERMLSEEDWLGMIHPDDRERAQGEIRDTFTNRTPYNTEYRVVWPDGSVKWVSSMGKLFFDSKGTPIRMIGTMTEIDERKLAEEALRKSNTRYEHLFSRMIDGFALHEIICDESGKPVDYRFLAMNPAFERLTGLKGSDLIGKRAYEEMPGLEPIWAERYGAVALKGEAIHFEEYSAPLDKHFEITAYRPASGQFATIFTDITETKRLRELESRAQRLETAGQIAGQVAHDFNNLLAPLMAYPEFIRDELGSDHPALQYLDDIENASQQIADINQQLLTLGRRGHYNQEVMNLNDVVSQAVRQMEVPPSTLAIETILDKEPMNIKGGRSQIFRAISNLLVNAREAMQDIGQLTVKTENFYIDKMWINYAQVPPGEYVKLTISDTGCGVPDEIRLKIFEPFFTTKTADKKRGSGLGISVVDAVVKDHEGYVDLTSTMGEGTSFFLYFPVTREVIEVPTQNELTGGDETVLIVDDDKVQRDVCTKLLNSLGYTTTSVDSGEEAVRLLGEQSFDLLILDMIMPPGIDGAETYRQTQSINPDQKAIIVSGFAESDRVEAALKMGAGAFVKKPLTRRRLATAVREELDCVTKPS